MNYQKTYNSIIKKAKVRDSKKDGYLILERHHIVPKSCGGDNSKDNLVNLTLREHFICHVLLTKIYKYTKHHHKMLRAAFLMTRGGNYNSKTYLDIKEAHVKNLRLQVLTEEHKQKISQSNIGKKLSNEHKYKLRELRLGKPQKPRNEETKKKISESLKGKPKSEEWKKKLSEELKGKPRGPYKNKQCINLPNKK